MNKKTLFGSLSLLIVLFSTPFAYGNTRLSNGFIIKYKNSASLEKFSACPIIKLNCSRIKKLNMEVVETLPPGIENNKHVEYYEPNYIYHALTAPSDNLYYQQWALQKIMAEKAWEISQGSTDVIVGVVDTGIDYTHSDIKDQMWVNDNPGPDNDIYGANFVVTNDQTPAQYLSLKGDPKDDHGHGTHCAGVIGAAHNGEGTVGINPHIRLMALKFLSADGSGDLNGAVNAITYGVDHGAKVLSNSWGGGPYSKALEDAISYAKDRGVLFVAAAGNEYNNNDSTPTYPASYKLDNIIAVAATDSSDNKADFSNFGLSVHIAAPGVDIISTILNGGYEKMSGTSMAAPHVSGAAALLLAAEPTLTFSDVKQRIIETSDYIPSLESKTLNAGRLNLANMLLNYKPERPLPPSEGSWVSYPQHIESEHPYLPKQHKVYTIEIPEGSKLFRAHFTKLETESKYDYVEISVNGTSVKYDGKLNDFYTKSIAVDGVTKVKMTFVSDPSVQMWGFDMDVFQV